MKTFKIGDAVKKPVERPRPGAKVAAALPAAPPTSVGFPRIEALVEAETPDLTGLDARMAALLELHRVATSPKNKLAAQRAARAYEKAKLLIEQLFATKKQLGQGPK
jgi:hypothetical protein